MLTPRKAVLVFAVLLIGSVLDLMHPLQTGPTVQEFPVILAVMAASAIASGIAAKKKANAAKAAQQGADADTQMSREDQQQALRRRQNVLTGLYANYGLDPQKYGLGKELGEGGIAQTPTPGAQDYYQMADMPERKYSSGWGDAIMGGVTGAIQGAASYYGVKPGDPSEGLTPSVGTSTYRNGAGTAPDNYAGSQPIQGDGLYTQSGNPFGSDVGTSYDEKRKVSLSNALGDF